MITEFSVSFRTLKLSTLKRFLAVPICVFRVLFKKTYIMLLSHYFVVPSDRKNNQNAIQPLKAGRLLDQ